MHVRKTVNLLSKKPRTERRKNARARDTIDIAIVYSAMFGTAEARDRMEAAGIDPHIVERVLSGRCRAKLFFP